MRQRESNASLNSDRIVTWVVFVLIATVVPSIMFWCWLGAEDYGE